VLRTFLTCTACIKNCNASALFRNPLVYLRVKMVLKLWKMIGGAEGNRGRILAGPGTLREVVGHLFGDGKSETVGLDVIEVGLHLGLTSEEDSGFPLSTPP
jgi:hypothetical protein